MKYISFSLFGTDPIYLTGALRNAELAKTVYPGWKCVFWVERCFTTITRNQLVKKGAEIHVGPGEIHNQMFWRFLVSDFSDCDRFIIRDTDSRLSEREARAVAAWVDSPCAFHSMRDHPAHTLPLGGGLWGAVKGAFPNMRDAIIKGELANTPYERQTQYGSDQTFLSTHVWPVAKRSCLEHDSCNRRIYPKGLPFPDGCSFGQARFVGEIIGANEQPHFFHWQQRVNYMTP